MKTSEFDYQLPKSFIAQNPAEPRDSSRLLVYDTATDKVYHKRFFEVKEFLKKGDVLVLNKSKVVPARIIFKVDGKECEIFLLKKLDESHYRALVRPGKFFEFGAQIDLNENLSFLVKEVPEDGSRVLEFFSFKDHFVIEKELERLGTTPLPPYITASSAKAERYQTVYAEEKGSVAAPTAGLHFTERLLGEISEMGVEVEKLLLHVGQGTFQPVKSEEIEGHKMHSEVFEMSEGVAESLNRAKVEGRRIVAVGTTSVRVLESCFDHGQGHRQGGTSGTSGKFKARSGETEIFIYPGYEWKAVDAMITNFHLPKSSLLMLVASFLEGKGVGEPVAKLLELYEIAKKEGYRFFSFGDAMMVV